MGTPKDEATPIRLLALVEATSVNAVAKNVLDFHRTTRDLNLSAFQTSAVTFSRRKNGRSDSQDEFVRAALESGLEIDVIPERGRFDLRVLPALRRIIKRRAPHIVVTHQVKSHFLMKLSGLVGQFPWVAFHHGYTTTDRKVRAYNQLNRWSLPSADKVVTVCGVFARDLELAGVRPDRIHVQHNSIRPGREVSAAEVLDLKKKLRIETGERIVLSVGRLSREKAHIDLLAAFKLLQEINPASKARLVIAGDGPERRSLEATAGNLGLSERVIFTGEVNDVQPYYAAADLLVLPSHSEGSPYVLLEAMAANLPVVATAVGGVPEMVENEESALLVPAGDTQAMAMSIDRLLTDHELASRLRSNAAELVRTKYSPDTYVNSLANIYREILVSRK